jgi:hypothetical protein
MSEDKSVETESGAPGSVDSRQSTVDSSSPAAAPVPAPAPALLPLRRLLPLPPGRWRW